MSENPYAAPTTPSFDLESQAPTSERIRRTYLKHEASVKSIGTLYFLSALLLGGAMIIVLTYSNRELAVSLPIALVLLAIAAFQLCVALGLRKLKSWARIPAIIFACLGLFGFPIGTLISIYFLYLLCSKSGSMVFSSDYAKVISDTPPIKYRTSTLTWVILAILIILVIATIIYGGSA